MPDYMASLFAEHEARYRVQVLYETWGHLYPRLYRTYRGWIVFTWTAYGDLTIIDNKFRGMASSPVIYDDMNHLIGDLWEQKQLEEGGVYRWEGTYRRRKFAAEFHGSVKRINTDG
jgi:hypothetical protein